MSSVVHVGNVLDILPTLEAGSVNCVVTSPPYWGLRDYGTAAWDGGDEGCDHLAGPLCSDKSGLAGYTSENVKLRTNGMPYRSECGKCGARRIDSQLGLETTPELYVANMVAVFREVRRVLRDDGTLWLNLGDSYASGETGRVDASKPVHAGGPTYRSLGETQAPRRERRIRQDTGLKPKDLVGIPWRVAFALQADGWYLRSDIIWSKPNPMPESVTDRPTKAHEYVFLLSKDARYYYDHVAIKEPMKDVSLKRLSQPNVFTQPGGPKDPQAGNRSERICINNQAERLVKHEKWKTRFEGWDEFDKSLGRNVRTVWEIATQPYPKAHFATYPEKLVEPCVLAGCPAGGTVLDPFTGSGTTGAVACRLGRNFVGIELSPEYAEMAERRIAPHRDQMQMVVT